MLIVLQLDCVSSRGICLLEHVYVCSSLTLPQCNAHLLFACRYTVSLCPYGCLLQGLNPVHLLLTWLSARSLLGPTVPARLLLAYHMPASSRLSQKPHRRPSRCVAAVLQRFRTVPNFAHLVGPSKLEVIHTECILGWWMCLRDPKNLRDSMSTNVNHKGGLHAGGWLILYQGWVSQGGWVGLSGFPLVL